MNIVCRNLQDLMHILVSPATFRKVSLRYVRLQIQALAVSWHGFYLAVFYLVFV